MKDHYFTLAKLILPEGLLDHFDITEVSAKDSQVCITLSEGNLAPTHIKGKLHSKGFYPSITLTDFPVRDKELQLIVRRRKWEEVSTGKIVKKDWDLIFKGSKYTIEFGAFLKEMDR